MKLSVLFTVAAALAPAAAYPLLAPYSNHKKLPEHLLKRSMKSDKNTGGAVVLNMKVSTKNRKVKTKSKVNSIFKTSGKSVLTGANDYNSVNATYANQSIGITIENEYSLYSAEFCFGTPCQMVELQIDTGSADIWVPSVDSTVKSANTGNYSDTGFYDIKASRTAIPLNETFSIRYGDGTGASGIKVVDDVKLGAQIDIPFVAFEMATQNTAGQGVCGFGFPSEQVATNKYDNFPMLMYRVGLIKSPSFSLYLNSQDAAGGQLALGAIDTAKYEGELVTLPMLKKDSANRDSSDYKAFFIEMTSMSHGNSLLTNKTYNALIDTGTTLVYAPTEVYNAYTSNFTYDANVAGYVAPCSTKGEPLKFTFGGNSTITVPFSDMLYKITMTDGSYYTNMGVQMCSVGMVNGGSDYVILGDIFLRSAYTFVDQLNHTISLAQVKYTNATNLIAV